MSLPDQGYTNTYKNSWALVIGLDQYKDPALPPLGTAAKGAREFAALLVKQFGFAADHVAILENEQATQGAIRRAFTDPLGRKDKVGRDDRILIYFAGHGITFDTAEGDIGCITAYDSEVAYWDTAIPMDELTRLANRSHAKHALFLLDACFSGYATTRAADGSAQRQLDDYLTHSARQVIAAGTRNQTVSDTWGPGGHSLFTGFLLEGLRGAAPAPGGILRVYHLAGYLQDAVAQHSRSRQTPQYATLLGSDGGDLIFEVRALGGISIGLLASVESSKPEDRLGAVGELRLIIQKGNQEQADRAFGFLQKLAADSDEMVKASARGALRALLPETSVAPLVRDKLLAVVLPPDTGMLPPRQSLIHAVLLVKDGAAPVWRYEMIEPILSIGRVAGNTLSFPHDDRLSRRHAQLEQRGDQFWLTDLGSTNGTFINGTLLEHPCALKEGDQIYAGNLMITVRLSEQPLGVADKTVADGKELAERVARARSEPAAPTEPVPAAAPVEAPTVVAVGAHNINGLRAARRLKGHNAAVTSVAWSSDGTRLVTGSADKTVMVWSVSGDQLQVFQGHTSEISDVVWSPDGVRIASCSWDSTVIIWDSSSGRRLRVLPSPGGLLTKAAWTPDGSMLSCGTRYGTIVVWDASTGSHMRNLAAHTGTVNDLAWSPDGLWLASGAADKMILIWDALSAEWQRAFEGHTAPVSGVVWSPNGQQIASSSSDGKIIIWQAATGKQIGLLDEGAGEVHCLAWSPHDGVLAAGLANGGIVLWNTETHKRMRLLDVHSKAITHLGWSYDGSRLASSSIDGKVILWELTAEDPIGMTGESRVGGSNR